MRKALKELGDKFGWNNIVIRIQFNNDNIRIGFPKWTPYSYVKVIYNNGTFEFNFMNTPSKSKDVFKISNKQTDRSIQLANKTIITEFKKIGVPQQKQCMRYKTFLSSDSVAFLAMNVGAILPDVSDNSKLL